MEKDPIQVRRSHSHRELIKTMDGVMGTSLAILLLMFATKWYHHTMTTPSLVVVVLFLCGQVIISQFSARSTSIFPAEIVRYIFTAVCAPFVMAKIGGVSGFLYAYMGTYLGCMAVIGMLRISKWYGWFALIFWSSDLLIGLMLQQKFQWEDFITYEFLFVLVGLGLKQVTRLLQENLQREVEWSREMESSHMQLIKSAKFAALGEMAGGMAHEINNPLAILLLTADHMQVLIESTQSDLESTQDTLQNLKGLAERMALTTERIAEIIRGLLSFSRSGERDSKQLEKVDSIITRTRALCEMQLRSKGIHFNYESAENLWIHCRPVQISQVLLNLINNAVYELDHVDSELKILSIRAYAKSASVFIDVENNGRCIPSELIEKIMQPFFTTKPVGQGTGLGLSISLGIMKEHQGNIHVHSKPGLTCFSVELPLSQS